MGKMNDLLNGAVRGLKKYKIAVVILLLGVGLLLIPGKSREEAPLPGRAEDGDLAYVEKLENRLETVLSQCQGAGQVRVVLTLERGTETSYQSDVQTSSEGERTSQDRKTVILSQGSAYDKAAVAVLSYPRFQGALILCQGAGDPRVELKLVQGVAALTGLGTNQITVIKMK